MKQGIRKSVSWSGKAVMVALVAALLLPTLFMGPASVAQAKAQPALLALAAEQPAAMVRVIAQMNGDGDGLEAAVNELGGRMVSDLPIINAFAAEMAAAAAVELAADPAIAWVSLNAPVTSTQSSGSVTFETWASELSAESPDVALIEQDFKDMPMAAGNTIWFNSIAKIKSLDESPVTVRISQATVRFNADGVDYELAVPDGSITVSAGATSAGTQFDDVSNTWHTTIPFDYNKETFLTGLAFTLPVDVHARIQDVTWTGRFSSDRPDQDFDVEWKSAAALYSQFSLDANLLGIKAVKDSQLSNYGNDDQAGTPEQFKPYLLPGARGNGGTNYTGDFSGGAVALGFGQVENIVNDGFGPDGAFGSASKMAEGFSGFEIEVVPGYAISKVEAMLHLYSPEPMGHDLKLKTVVNGHEDNSNFSKNLCGDSPAL